LFDSQLRRLGLSPDAVDEVIKQKVVSRLGGHPVGIAIAADVAYSEGIDALKTCLEAKQGALWQFLQALIRQLDISDDERKVLQLLGSVREAIPREVLVQTLGHNAISLVRNLISLAAIEVNESGLVQIAGILREYFDISELQPDLAKEFHIHAARAFEELAKSHGESLFYAVEAEYHGSLAGIGIGISSRLTDGAFAAAKAAYETQLYDRAGIIIDALLKRHATLEIKRLASLVEARRNHFKQALKLAREVFAKNPKDTWLLSDLAKIALSQFQDQMAEELIGIARSAHVEDVSILIVEGRMLLRRSEVAKAELVFSRARQLSEHNPWPYFYLGECALRLGKLEDAMDVLHEGEEFIYRVESRSRRVLSAIKTKLGVAYLLAEKLDLASPYIESVIAEDPQSPEAIRAFAALTIKREGITEAERALTKFREAGMKSRYDRCQFHLLYGLFYLGIDQSQKASEEFEKAHRLDNANVFVMMKWARTLYDLGQTLYMDGSAAFRDYLVD
jgi:Tfp pilus assembly protein PilF